MKTLLAFLIFATFAVAASAPVVTETLQRIQCDPATGTAQAFFERQTTIDGQVYKQPWTQVSWPVGSTKTVTYTYNGQTYTQPYAQVMAAVVAIANQENSP